MVSFAIDRGGTFTDIYATFKGKVYIEKLLSIDLQNYEDAPVEGIRRVLERIFNKKIKYGEIDSQMIKWVRMGTTVATNALLERKGERCALITTKGFRDVLEIGYQNRPKLFDLNIKKPSMLYEKVVEVDERILIENQKAIVEKEINPKKLKEQLYNLKQEGFNSIAIVFMHSYIYDNHEKIAREVAKEIGFSQISLSSEIMPSIKFVDRGDISVVDAYLTPHIKSYIESFQRGFLTPLKEEQLLFMQSHGGLSEAKNFRGANSLLSGPAGGIIGYAKSFYTNRALIGFDMGGTSSDVSRYDGNFFISYENEIDNIKIKTPQIEILTVAAGGGSRLFYKNSLFYVGPESSGANPGPVCYKKGGYLSITDANLILGRIQSDYFPPIFGKNQNEPLGEKESREEFLKLAKKINLNRSQKLSLEEIAYGFLEVANENMIKPIKEISTQKGFDITTHALCAFGGAGGQHACAIARKLGISEIYIHRYSGILSAFGLNEAKRSVRKQISVNRALNLFTKEMLLENLKELQFLCDNELNLENISYKSWYSLKYRGSEHIIFISTKESVKKAFEEEYLREFGFLLDNQIEIVDIILEATSSEESVKRVKEPKINETKPKTVKVYFKEGWLDTKIYELTFLNEGKVIFGPAIIMNETSTILIEPKCKATILEYKDIKIELNITQKETVSKVKDPIKLAIFNNQFISIASQAGRALQKTAVSTNIKERLDFSCALFDKEGNLIANAPHIPVHLGAMSHTIKHIIKNFKINKGDSFITNDPQSGGSHLPDITLITPYIKSDEILFFTANRGHHGDIGGVTPGSMPPFSTNINQEGALIKPMKIVEQNLFKEKEIREIFQKANARNIDENISDIKAQILSNQKAISLMKELFNKYSIDIVLSYMLYLQEVSANAVEKFLKKHITKELEAEDFLDDGSKIALKIYRENDKYLFDFSATSIGCD